MLEFILEDPCHKNMGRLCDKSTELSIISYQIQDELAHAVFLLAWHCVCVCVYVLNYGVYGI